MLCVNIAAKSLDIDTPAAFIDDNTHTGVMTDLSSLAPDCWAHLHRPGLTGKPEKREFLDMMDDSTGAWFDSIRMTLSMSRVTNDFLAAMIVLDRK